jgi:hypothetical protein
VTRLVLLRLALHPALVARRIRSRHGVRRLRRRTLRQSAALGGVALPGGSVPALLLLLLGRSTRRSSIVIFIFRGLTDILRSFARNIASCCLSSVGVGVCLNRTVLTTLV